MAMTAWSANVSSSAICLGAERRRTSGLSRLRTPITFRPLRSGAKTPDTPSRARSFSATPSAKLRARPPLYQGRGQFGAPKVARPVNVPRLTVDRLAAQESAVDPLNSPTQAAAWRTIADAAEEDRIAGPAVARCSLRDTAEHAVEIGGRGGDHPQHLGGGHLLLAGLGQLGDERRLTLTCGGQCQPRTARSSRRDRPPSRPPWPLCPLRDGARIARAPDAVL